MGDIACRERGREGAGGERDIIAMLIFCRVERLLVRCS